MISDQLTLIIPTKNHEQLILDNLDEINNFCKNNFEKYEILIISNGSSDENLALLSKVNISQINHLSFSELGKGFAVRKGIENSKYRYSLICDADLSVDLNFVEQFFDNLKPLSGFVVGSRKLKDSEVNNTPVIRLISGGLFTFLIRFILGIKVSDTQCGFKLIDNSKFIDASKFKSDDFFFDVELFLLAKEKNIEVTEVPVVYNHNFDSSVSLFIDSLRMFIKIFSTKFKSQ